MTFGPGFARWEKELPGGKLVSEGFVPLEENRRILRITLTGASGRLFYRLNEEEPSAAPLHDGQSVSLVTKEKEGRPCSRFFREDFAQEEEHMLAWWRDKVSALTVQTPAGPVSRQLVPLSSDGLPHHGPNQPVSKRRGLWVSRPASGRSGSFVHLAGPDPGAAAAGRFPTV